MGTGAHREGPQRGGEVLGPTASGGPARGVASEGRGALTSTRPSHPPIPSDTPSAPPAAGLGPDLSPCLCQLTPFLPGVRWGSGCLSTQFECVFDLTGQILLGRVSHVHSDMLCCCIPM